MSRPAQEPGPKSTMEDDDCMHDIQYGNDTVRADKDEDAAMASDADDEMEDDVSGEPCRGQKRRLHTVCEMSYAARSKMIKQLDHSVT